MRKISVMGNMVVSTVDQRGDWDEMGWGQNGCPGTRLSPLLTRGGLV